jgi:hypothetical protein
MPKPKLPVTYTPGPLGIQPMPGQSYRILGGPRHIRLADVYSTAAHNGEANARLFAAAPDLYEAAITVAYILADHAEFEARSDRTIPAELARAFSLLQSAIARAADMDLPQTAAPGGEYICDECGGTRVRAAAVPCHVCNGAGRTSTGPESHRLPAEQSKAGDA